MSNLDLGIEFPDRSDLIKGNWAPIIFAPHVDSPERIVLGIAAWESTDFIVLPADASQRLKCVFGDAARTALLAQKAAVNTIREQMSLHGPESLSSLTFSFSGISIGDVSVGQAQNLESLAKFWLNRVSFFHNNTREEVQNEIIYDEEEVNEVQINNDRLPVLVYRAIEQNHPNLINYFSNEIRSRARKLPRPAPQKVFIGFAGQGVVANFATLRPTKSRVMVDHIKRLMWDLARFRDDEVGQLPFERQYEMVVYRRPLDDPELTRAQDQQLNDVVSDLTDQGAKESIDVQTRFSVDGIAEHLGLAERRASELRLP